MEEQSRKYWVKYLYRFVLLLSKDFLMDGRIEMKASGDFIHSCYPADHT